MDTLTRMRAFISVIENEGFSAAARKTGRSKALFIKICPRALRTSSVHC